MVGARKVQQMGHLHDVVKLHTFVLGHLGALLLACFGFDLRFALVAFDLVSDSTSCEGVGVAVGAGGGEDLGRWGLLERCSRFGEAGNLKTTNRSRSHTHTQA